MSLEAYAVHIAPRGGTIDAIVTEFEAAREAAYTKRMEYAQSKGAIGTYGTEGAVSGLLFPYTTPADKWGYRGATAPDGWAITSRFEDGVVVVPKAKDRTKAERVRVKGLRDELAALPKMPGAWEFTNRIGGSQVLGAGEGRGFCLRSCVWERVGDTTFVLTPWCTKQEETGNLADDDKVKTAFLPEGCERVGLSAYYAAKEGVEKRTQVEVTP